MIIFDYSKFDQEKMYLLIHRIKETKHVYNEDLDPHYAEKGRRYQDDARIAQIVCGYFLEEFKQPINGNSGYYNVTKANEKFLSLSTSQIDPYIRKAIIESAEADYYYNREKEY